MKMFTYLFLSFLIITISEPRYSDALTDDYRISSLNRTSFPRGFVFGAASSAYQIEGGANEDGRGPSIWDTFTQKYPEKIKDHSTGNVACDSYHLYKEDVKLLKKMGVDAYRFSISWSRLLPHGKLSGGVNEAGIQYYNNLIDELLKKGIEPYVTIFHWDVPQALEDEYGGFLSPKIVKHFSDYAELCYKKFGDRVKNWITLNEPYTFTNEGYAKGSMAPGRCSSWQNSKCLGGNSGIEPYLASHYQLLAHGAAVKIYRDKYQKSQKGQIGITLYAQWMVPYSDETNDRKAAKRTMDFHFGWYMDPVIYGDYPDSMKSLVKDRLPKFSKEESEMLKSSIDFLGLNYYTANYAKHFPKTNSAHLSYLTDSQAQFTTERDGVPIGPRAASTWLYIYPKGIRDLLLYIKKTYKNPTIYITENGRDELDNPKLSLKEALVDNWRIEYYFSHLSYVRKAIKKGVNVKGFFPWSLLDNFEWASGYSLRFGLHYVDYKDGAKRYPKLSAKWFKNFLHNGKGSLV